MGKDLLRALLLGVSVWVGAWELVFAGENEVGVDGVLTKEEEPEPDDQQEVNPVELLPEEMWVQLLKYLGLKDWALMARVHPVFLSIVQGEEFLGPREIWERYKQIPKGFFEWDVDARLFAAAKLNLWHFAQQALNRGVRVDAVNFDDRWNTALHYAAKAGSIYAAMMLLKHGASIDAANSLGNTPLHEAAISGNLEAAKFLLEQGANRDALNSRRYSALHLAAQCGSAVIVRLLLEWGAAVDSLGGHNATPMLLAARAGRSDVVAVLIEYGAGLRFLDYQERSVVRLAAESGNARTLQQIINAGVQPEPNEMIYCLRSAVSFRDDKIICILLQLRPDVAIARVALQSIRQWNASIGDDEPEPHEHLLEAYVQAQMLIGSELLVRCQVPEEARK
ncbi:MAG: hypothetical protein Tsb0018_00900 [Opitutales bacterium]